MPVVAVVEGLSYKTTQIDALTNMNNTRTDS